MTASKLSATLLRRILDVEGEIKLPKHIIVKDEESGQKAYLAPNILAPTSEFSFIETLDYFIVSKSVSAPVETFEEALDDIENIFTDESDDDDVVYSHFGPASRQGTNFCDDSNDDLPSPSYTPMTFHDLEVNSDVLADVGDGGGGGDGGGDGGGGYNF